MSDSQPPSASVAPTGATIALSNPPPVASTSQSHRAATSSFSYLKSWIWPTEIKPMRAADAAHTSEIRHHFVTMLDNTDPPKTFSPKAVAQQLSQTELSQLGYKSWEETIPAIYELIWELRAFGDLIIIYKGRIVPEDVMYYELEGPIRVMRAAD